MTYKTIIHNIIEREVRTFIEAKARKFPFIDERKISTRNEKDSVMFTIEDIQVSEGIHYNTYRVSGYINEYGTVRVCSVAFERTYCDVNFKNVRKEHFFIFGEDLKTFKFDK